MQKLWKGFISIILTVVCTTVIAAPSVSENQVDHEIDLINQALLAEKNKIDDLKKNQQHSLEQLAEQRKTLATQLENAYKLRQSQSAAIFFNQQNPKTVARYLIYYRYLNENRSRLIKEIKLTLTHIKQQMNEIAQHQQNLNVLLQKKLAQRHSSSSITVSQNALQSELNDFDIQPNNILRTRPQTFLQSRGKLQWPVRGQIIRHFGSALEVGQQRFPGTLIKTPSGTPVHSIYQGKVVFASYLKGFGLLIIVNHGNGFMSLYAHNKTLFAKIGQTVKTGAVIASTGNSGGYATPGLYFELRQNGAPINPHSWLSTV